MPLSTSARSGLKKLWVITPPDDRAGPLAKSLNVSPLLAQVLINRGTTEVAAGAAFLRPRLAGLISPERMPGVGGAVARIIRAIEEKQKITIYGDYDVDGITGVSILWQLLKLLGAEVDYYIPHRVDEGYGLNADAVRSIAESGSDLLVTVDCGITAFESARLAKQLGLDLVITDHHQFCPGSEGLPESAAIVHPALEAGYPNQDSAGAMVAFKLAWALATELNGGKKLGPEMRNFMLNATSLAAMGTIADVVDLRGENRILVSYGLKSLSRCDLCGITALIESAGLAGKGLDSIDIGFRLAPMLNAAGRMGHARLAVELLTSESQVRSAQIAEYLKGQNELRRRCEQKIYKQACKMILEQGANHPDRRSIVLASEDWHTGVIGIVASRLVERFYRPTILINTASENGIAQGSGRSVPGFCLLSAIKACSGHLTGFGGHEMAAGLTIPAEKVGPFAADFEEYARQNLNEEDVLARLRIDAEAKLGQFNRDMVAELEMLGPFGQGNPQPVFATMGVRLACPPRRVGSAGNHLQMTITDGLATIRCIGFRFGRFEKKLLEHEFFDVAYRPQLNTYNGYTHVQFVLADIRFE